MDFKQKYEPRGDKIIHGAGQSLEAFSNYWKAVEDHKPVIYMTYAKINNLDKWINKIEKEIKNFPNLILQIGLKLIDLEGKDKTKEILESKYDKELDRFLNTIKKLKNPIFLRIGYEFDKAGKYDSERFRDVWKKIVDRFREKEIDNIATVWCSCPYNGTSPVEPYYPGDDYVDWFGIDVFSVKHLSGRYKPVEDFIKLAKKHKKPVMVGESTPARIGVDNGMESWNLWFKPYFKWVRNHKQIKAFCYINWNWALDYNKPEWLNGRIHENEYVRKKFVDELENSRYMHNQKMKDFLDSIYSSGI